MLAYVDEVQDTPCTRADRLTPKLRKYRFMEKSFTQKKVGLEDKIPEFQNTIDVLLLLEQKRVSRLFLRTQID